MRRFRSPALPGPDLELLLDEAASHHLLRVSGIAPGERVEVFDGAGAAATAELVGAQGGRAVLVQRGPVRREAPREIILLIGLSKHAAFDTLLRMATELGVWRIQPFEAARSVVRGERVARWERIVEAAAAQCGRADLPEVRAACSLAEALRALPPDGERRVLVPGAAGLPPPAPPCVLLVGPEGGLDPREVEAALAEGFQAEGIGSTVLRVDTAVAAALARVR
jgi:16S rRNA (uracil1498-N3)-methyltransferase